MASKKSRKPTPKPSESHQDPRAVTPAETSTPDQRALEESPSESSTLKDQTRADIAHSTPTKTWLGGTWPRKPKAIPDTQTDRTTISTGNSSNPELATSLPSSSPSAKTTRSPSLHLTNSSGSGNRTSLPDTSITKVNVTSNESRHVSLAEGQSETSSKTTLNRKTSVKEEPAKSKEEQPRKGEQKTEGESGEKKEQVVSAPEPNTSSWFGWLSRDQVNKTAAAKKPNDTQEGKPSNLPKTDISTEPSPPLPPAPISAEAKVSETPRKQEEISSTQPARSWLPMWNTSQAPTKSDVNKNRDELVDQAAKIPIPNDDTPTVQPSSSVDKGEPKIEPSASKRGGDKSNDVPSAPKSSGWAFWSRDRGKDSKAEDTPSTEVGELAVSDTPSQIHPESAVVDERGGIPNTSKSGKAPSSVPAERKADDKTITVDTSSKRTPEQPPQDKVKEGGLMEASKQLQKAVPNLILPTFRNTFEHQQSPSFLQQIAQFLGYNKSPEQRHVSILKNPAPIKKAVAIGVHGFFPATLLRTVLGQPTGTSIKFSNMAAKAIRKWTEARGIACEVEKISLEGEGKIAERVDMLWKLLLNWIDEIRKADFILVACHSQGVPVSVMLVAKLIMFGCSSARIGLCCMAGINQGPFADYKSRFISGSAAELFDFSNPNSRVSEEYTAALEVCLRHGVKILYAGSIDDQLVSLESSTFTGITHPHIYRAVFVDGKVHAPSFLSHLVGFALKLRNLGVPDHGLIRELSSPLAGSIYTGEGHSRIYDDEAIYDLAVEHALETTSVGVISPHIQHTKGTVTPNPYILPFAMRGLLEEEHVRREMHDETSELLQQFDDWKPTTKALKDVKFRLEGIRSKL